MAARRGTAGALFLLAVATTLAPLSIWAQRLPADVIITDRPIFTISPSTVEPLSLQAELAAFEISRLAVSDTRLTMPFKLRFGLAPRPEIDVESPGLAVAITRVGSGDRVGFSDLALGFKTTIVDGGGVVPKLGLQLVVTIPTGTSEFSGASYRLSPTLLAAWSAGPWGVGGNFGVTSSMCTECNQVDSGRWSVALSRSYLPLTPRVASFVEVYGEAPFCRGRATFNIDAGAMWLVTPYVQLDFAVRVGLNEPAPDVGGTMGVSFKV
jgi:hypothetical protein